MFTYPGDSVSSCPFLILQDHLGWELRKYMVRKQWSLEIPFLGVFIVKDSDGVPIGTVEVCASTHKSTAVVHCVVES